MNLTDELAKMGWSEEEMQEVQKHLDGLDWEEYEYSDNFRFARKGNRKEIMAYWEIRLGGCCGFYDEEVGNFLVGFNYGH